MSSRISENERIEVSGVRSSWLTVARKSSLSWSSWRSRSLASRSSAVACSSAARLLLEPPAVLDHLRGLVQDLHQIVGADHLAAHDRADHHPGRGRSRSRGRAGARRAGPGRRRPARRAPARGRAGAGRRANTVSARSGPGSGSAARAGPRPWPRRATGRPGRRCSSTSTNSTAWSRSSLPWRPSSAAEHDESDVEAEAPDQRMADGAQALEPEQRLRPQERHARTGRRATKPPSIRPAVASVGRTSV